MATPDDIENRLTSVEREVARLREQTALAAADASAARILSAGADRDVSEVRAELRAHTSALNALRETQVDFGNRLDDVGNRLDDVGNRLEDQQQTMTRGFATMGAGMAQIVSLIEGLADRDR